MQALKVAARIEQEGELHLRALPLQVGEAVEVIILSTKETSRSADTRDLARAARGMWADRDPDAYLEESRAALDKRDEELKRARLGP